MCQEYMGHRVPSEATTLVPHSVLQPCCQAELTILGSRSGSGGPQQCVAKDCGLMAVNAASLRLGKNMACGSGEPALGWGKTGSETLAPGEQITLPLALS